jgi:hypothetical protein
MSAKRGEDAPSPDGRDLDVDLGDWSASGDFLLVRVAVGGGLVDLTKRRRRVLGDLARPRLHPASLNGRRSCRRSRSWAMARSVRCRDAQLPIHLRRSRHDRETPSRGRRGRPRADGVGAATVICRTSAVDGGSSRDET